MQEQQKQYAKDFLLEIHNQVEDLQYNRNYISVDDNSIEWLEGKQANLQELGSYDGFTAFYKHGLELKLYFYYAKTLDDAVDENNDSEVVTGYFSLYILFFENETKLICELVKDIENVRGCGGISYEPVSELIYEKTINWQDLNDYDFQCQEYEFFKQAITNKQF